MRSTGARTQGWVITTSSFPICKRIPRSSTRFGLWTAPPRDGELRSYLAQFLFSGEDVFNQVRNLSGGEKSRVALAKIIYQAPTILALDEPTNHLDIASREALEAALVDYPGTILFVTHDRYLAQKLATHLLYIEDRTAHVFDRLSAFEEWLERGCERKARGIQRAKRPHRQRFAGQLPP